MIFNPSASGGSVEHEIVDGPAHGFPVSAKAGEFVVSTRITSSFVNIIAEDGNEVPHGLTEGLTRAPEQHRYFVMPDQPVHFVQQ